jgi:hypothetical protein
MFGAFSKDQYSAAAQRIPAENSIIINLASSCPKSITRDRPISKGCMSLPAQSRQKAFHILRSDTLNTGFTLWKFLNAVLNES